MFTPWRIVLTLLLVPATASAADLRWQFRKDQVFKYTLKHRETRTVEVADQKLETTTTTEYEWTWTVQDVNDEGVATLAHRFTALRVESTGKDFDFRYDSAQGSQETDDYKKKLIHVYDQLRFGDYRVQLRPDGRVVGVTGFDKLLGEINADPAVLDFHALNLHDDTFGWFLQHALGLLPPKDAAGPKWEASGDAKLPTAGEVMCKTTYQLGKPDEESRAVVSFQGSRVIDTVNKWLGNTLTGTLRTTKLEGELRFDPKAASVSQSKVEIDLGGELRFGNETDPTKLTVRYQHTLELTARP